MATGRHNFMGSRLQTAHIAFGTANSHIKSHHTGATDRTLVLLQTSHFTPIFRLWQCFTLAPFTPLRLSISFITVSLSSPCSSAFGYSLLLQSRLASLLVYSLCLIAFNLRCLTCYVFVRRSELKRFMEET